MKNQAQEREAYIQDMKSKINGLEEELHQARDALEKQKQLQRDANEKKEKDIAIEQLEETSEHILNLKKDISEAKGGVCTAHGEKQCLEEMVEWAAEEDLVQEQKEVEELKEMMRRKKTVLTVYRLVIVSTWTYQATQSWSLQLCAS